MIYACINQTKLKPQEIIEENQANLQDAIWIDLLSPSKKEEVLVEKYIDIDIPRRHEMIEIELSSRLYKENGTLFMTATMIAQSDSLDPKLDPVTFILTPNKLITVRYIEPQSFKLFTSQLQKLDNIHHQATHLFLELLDATVNRLADILELIGKRLEEYSKTIFRPLNTEHLKKLDYMALMQQIGMNGDLNTKARESLLTFNRLVTFYAQTIDSKINEESQLRLITLNKDILSLSDHANFLSTKINFLLDATLGMVSIEQNNIIKLFSVAAVIFLPPTLIASIYGMNFIHIPELSWEYGYLFAIGLIILAAWLPYRYFKYKKWL